MSMTLDTIYDLALMRESLEDDDSVAVQDSATLATLSLEDLGEQITARFRDYRSLKIDQVSESGNWDFYTVDGAVDRALNEMLARALPTQIFHWQVHPSNPAPENMSDAHEAITKAVHLFDRFSKPFGGNEETNPGRDLFDRMNNARTMKVLWEVIEHIQTFRAYDFPGTVMTHYLRMKLNGFNHPVRIQAIGTTGK